MLAADVSVAPAVAVAAVSCLSGASSIVYMAVAALTAACTKSIPAPGHLLHLL